MTTPALQQDSDGVEIRKLANGTMRVYVEGHNHYADVAVNPADRVWFVHVRPLQSDVDIGRSVWFSESAALEGAVKMIKSWQF